MIVTDKRLRLNLLLLICSLIFIWGNSLLQASVSGAISDWLQWVLSMAPPSGPEAESSGTLRTLAHFTEFAALGFLLSWRFGMLKRNAMLAWFAGTAVACMDEVIQIFVPGRAFEFADIWMDSCGVAAGMLLLHLGHTYYRKRKQTHLEDK